MFIPCIIIIYISFQLCCKTGENKYDRKRYEIDVDYDKNNLNIITDSTNDKKYPSNLLNHPQNKVKLSELPIIEENRINNSEKILHIYPPLTFPNLFLNRKNIVIDEFGLQGSPNSYKGKLTFFGIDLNFNENKSISHVNDIVISEEITKPNINKTIALFYIYFEQKISHYILRSLAKGIYFSLCVNPYTQIVLDTQHKNYIKIGNIILSILINLEEEKIHINIKKGGGIEIEENYILEENKIPITIGRSNCTIEIKSDLISKTHITINCDKINKIFFLIDNGSTNGTQLLLNEAKTLQIHGEMDYNLGEKQFSIIEK